MPLSSMQMDYLMNANHRWNIKTGATGSGKSFMDFTVLIPKRLERLRGEGLVVFLGNTRGTLDRNIFEPMREWWPGLISDIHSDNTIEIFGKTCYAMGADNKKHVDRIRGSTIEYAYGDEVTTWSPDVFDMLKSRLRCPHSKFDGTCNPEGPQHWFKKFLDGDADIYQQNYTLYDNPFLTDDFVRNLEREYAGTVLFSRYINGLWTAAEGAIYTPWNDDSSRFKRSVSRQEISRAILGWDFGGNGSASAGVLIGVLKGYKGIAILREYYQKGVITPEKQEAAFVEFARGCQEDYGMVEVRCDSAEQTLIAGFKAAAMKAGLRVDIKNAIKGEITDRIRFTVRCMGRGAFFVDPGCVHVMEALSSAVYDPKYVTEDVRLDNGSTNIDSLDAMEYGFEPVMQAVIKTSGVT